MQRSQLRRASRMGARAQGWGTSLFLFPGIGRRMSTPSMPSTASVGARFASSTTCDECHIDARAGHAEPASVLHTWCALLTQVRRPLCVVDGATVVGFREGGFDAGECDLGRFLHRLNRAFRSGVRSLPRQVTE